MMQYKIGERIPIEVSRCDSHFDRACDSAISLALSHFGADDDGHFSRVVDHCRSTDSVHVAFVRYEVSGGMGGVEHQYSFEAWMSRHEDDE